MFEHIAISTATVTILLAIGSAVLVGYNLISLNGWLRHIRRTARQSGTVSA